MLKRANVLSLNNDMPAGWINIHLKKLRLLHLNAKHLHHEE